MIEKLIVGSASLLAVALISVCGLDAVAHLTQAAQGWRDHILAAMEAH